MTEKRFEKNDEIEKLTIQTLCKSKDYRALTNQ